jgi:hypothetical protein
VAVFGTFREAPKMFPANCLIIRENTGNLVDLGRFCYRSEVKNPHVHYAFSSNSLTIVTGNFDRGSGNCNSLISFRSGNVTGLISEREWVALVDMIHERDVGWNDRHGLPYVDWPIPLAP